jgi:hypothetical protein
MQTRTQARVPQQLLSEAEENALLNWIKKLTITGYPVRYLLLREMAEEIRIRHLAWGMTRCSHR